MRVLHVAPAFYPATYWGGPTHSTLGICQSLSEFQEVELRVLTTDTAGPRLSDRVDVSALPERYPPGFKVHFCRRVIGVDIAPQMLPLLWEWARWADVIHLTAVYSFPTIPTLLFARLMGKPVVWSPRGSLMRWQKSSRPAAKIVWEWICRALLNVRRTAFHATSSGEEESIRARMAGYRIAVVPNAVKIPDVQTSRDWLPDGKCRILFVGRLDPIKGIENLIRAIRILNDHDISLNICGSGLGAYADQLRCLVSELGLSHVVTFSGHVEGPQKYEAFRSADVLVLPSFSENFGMVVAEALAHGVPVIASTGTPWSQLNIVDCGLWIDNSPSSLASAIRSLYELDLQAMGMRGRKWVTEEYDVNHGAKKLLNLYTELISDCKT